jgi:ADP-L-glycero-D-manno-heptose 6-epimerase
MIIVTGAAGFIGSNLIKGLNARGINDIIAVDDLTNGHQFVNLVDCDIMDYVDKQDFILDIMEGIYDQADVSAIFHQGACSTTTEWNGKYMMDNNYAYSKQLLHFCIDHNVPFIYASSAAVYGGSDTFTVDPACERPLNVYGYSKLLFDNYVRRVIAHVNTQIVGLRYFNVYGPREQHKGSMASVALHHHNQIQDNGVVKLFGPYDNYGAGEQSRDFIYVGDVVNVNLWFMDHPQHRGIFNCGTGRAEPFNNIAKAVIDWHGKGKLEYIDFPDHLKGHYQSYTCANMQALHDLGYDIPFKTVAQGVKTYLNTLGK